MEIRRFQDGDEAAISHLIRRTLIEVNAKDHDDDEIQELYDLYTPEGIREIAREGHTYVIVEDGVIQGTGTITSTGERESEIIAAFLLPEAIGHGYGGALFDVLESDPLAVEAQRLWLTSSVMALGFYEKRGYECEAGYRTRSENGLFVMNKKR